jgi:hypothetical protein
MTRESISPVSTPTAAPTKQWTGGDIVDVYAYHGVAGKLMVEVTPTDTELNTLVWGSSGIDGSTVVYLRVVEKETGMYSVAASDDAIGICWS